MKKWFVVLFFILKSSLFAQNTEQSIVIKDFQTNLPIENATVIIMKTKQILLSNKDGKVTFMLNGASNVQVFQAAYVTQTIRWTALKQNQNTVYLKNKYTKLDEVIVTKENPQKILQALVTNSIKKLTIPAQLKVYAREFFKLNGAYAYYNDGLINFQLVANQKKVTTTLLVEQNRSYGLLEQEVSPDLLGYNLNTIMENYYSFKYLKPVLEPKATKDYDFIIKSLAANSDYYVMTVIPLDESKKAVDNFEIIYDPSKKIILEYGSKTSSKALAKVKEKGIVGSKNRTKSEFKVTYRIDGANYFLLTSNEEIGYDLVLKDKIKSIEVRNHFITTSFNKQNFTYTESDVFREKTLFNKKNTILTNYWDVSGFATTEEEQAIIKKLEFRL
ncbi:hypothetical protein [Flavobacterium restrictum]|uniref:Carboxypeptidase-like regulatory domain-containing protein n=1 Tax=Flavobacterium restrictum TaxID=2594428 RepID=A0A553DXT4_9FLAO|nr:hypothetical protein [Flavobacterium restrictum]TRX37591.1 hypothetical protein FNW21_12465 [Flavobacterium restrictum]